MLSILHSVGDHFQALLELIYPRLCVGCEHHLLKTERSICSICKLDLPYTEYDIHDNPLSDRFVPLTGMSGMYSMCYYNKGNRLQQFMHALKYQNQPEVGVELGKLLGRKMKESGLPEIDVVIPIPLHRKRLRSRGYNQSEKLAQGLGTEIGVKVSTDILSRNRFTESQTNKNRNERLENVKGAFSVQKPKSFDNKTVLLLDDVITTGATILSASNSLLDSGCGRLYTATLAKADDL